MTQPDKMMKDKKRKKGNLILIKLKDYPS